MKLAFIGTHGVGKTTLCYDLVARLKKRGLNVDMVKEVARLSPLPINQKTSLEAQTWILMTQVAEEIRSEALHRAVVCDRSVLDNYAYMARACGRHDAIEQFVEAPHAPCVADPSAPGLEAGNLRNFRHSKG